LSVKLVDCVQVLSKGKVAYCAAPLELWDNNEIKSRFLGI
jgi:hypothetical protein